MTAHRKTWIGFVIGAWALLGGGREALAVLGGETTVGDTFVVGYIFAGSPEICSGMLVAPRVVLTSATCIKDAVDAGTVGTGTGWWGQDQDVADQDHVFNIVDGRYHRLYEPLSFNYDVGVLLLDRDVGSPQPPPLAPLHGGAFPDGVAGTTLRVAGYGANVIQGSDYLGQGVRRTGSVLISDVGYFSIRGGDDTSNACRGDSGAPLFYDFGGVEGEKVVAIAADTSRCQIPTVKTRLDLVWADFVVPAIDAWDGPCRADGLCDNMFTCPRTPDPDCDLSQCGPDGVCNDQCAFPDWDCPLGGAFLEHCTGDFECESRACLTAPDDPRNQFCSRACTVQSVADVCVTGQSCQNGLCQYDPPSPGAQGFDCTGDASVCLSGLCHIDGYCMEPCTGPSDGSCPAPFLCLASSVDPATPFTCARTPAEQNNFCTVAASPAGAVGLGGLWLLLAAWLASYALARRRR